MQPATENAAHGLLRKPHLFLISINYYVILEVVVEAELEIVAISLEAKALLAESSCGYIHIFVSYLHVIIVTITEEAEVSYKG